MSDTVPTTLPELLLIRAQESTSAHIGYLDAEGTVQKELSYTDLYRDALKTSQLLVAYGLRPEADIVITYFEDHESHIRLFWACALAGIPVCPLPPLHPDRSRQALFLNHLSSVFRRPTLIANKQTIADVRGVAPDLRALSFADIEHLSIDADTLASVYPSRPISPDDIVCLMLTSGSTGNSKAVALRHSNLLSSVRGKIKHHKTTSRSRFLNWIAFDHVACTSEVHLHALAAGASQYHVAPFVIIQRPRNLLEWCSRLRITYSFSPNFLIAQLCRDATAAPYSAHELDLSALVAIISGGEAVPIQTAVEFADLLERYGAPRNALRSGFGMSETGGGSIYDTRDIVRNASDTTEKYLSLGECCTGITARVVSRDTGEVCDAFVPGQLQVKGPTVFREYYNNPKVTAESITADGWFTTGDSGMFDKDGNLHLVGRDKDQININGIKHPCADAEHFIEESDIDGVSHSYIFVCPMRLPGGDTDTYAVFYQHRIRVENELSEEDVAALCEANRAIRKRCIVFCSQGPHVVLPLPRKSFSKSALGKVSRSALMAAYLKGDHAALEQRIRAAADRMSGSTPLNPVEQIVFKVVADLLNIDVSRLSRSASLFDMGVSSIHLVRLKHLLEQELHINEIAIIDMLSYPDLGELCDYIGEVTKASATEGAPTYNPLVCMNSHGSKPPVFLVHPGLGEVLVFVSLARALNDDRPVYALRARGFGVNEEPFDSWDEMVETYTAAIEERQPEGPYYLGGYSIGGAIAFEIGRKLESRGKHVAWVGIFNLMPHFQFRMHDLPWLKVLLHLFLVLELISEKDFVPIKDQLLDAFPDVTPGGEEPAGSTQVVQWLIKHSDQQHYQQLQLQPDDMRRWVGVIRGIVKAGRDYVSQGPLRGGLITVLCAAPLASLGTREDYKQNRLSVWKIYGSNGVELVDLDGAHYTMLSDDNVHSFASKMRAAMERAPKVPTPPPSFVSKNQLVFDKIPVVDWALSESDPAAYYEQLRTAFEEVGFGVFTNIPGFDDEFQKKIFAYAEQLCSKPQAWKDAISAAKSNALRGYFRGDDTAGDSKAHSEGYRFGTELPEPVAQGDEEVPFYRKLQEGPNQWPAEADLPGFRSALETLFERYISFNLQLNKHICTLLDIPEVVLNEYYTDSVNFTSVIWHYLPLTPEMRATAKNGFVKGMHEHRDPSTLYNCLIQSRPGLQVQNHAGEWIDIPLVKGGVVCNIGLQLMKLSGGKFVAATHRVNTLGIDTDRYTIPYALSTRLEKPVVPLPKFSLGDATKYDVPPNPKLVKLLSVSDPLVRGGYAWLTLFPAAAKKLYPKEWAEAKEMGIL
ncbi:uncharacterized protein PHACADRAFT_259209 [Phanerochaete carnosa HHB-10118-sp]|uniref:Carrier domain-containing protein n=1 Tax=Phanerochaete carnosa (strain HHB-10118-sp) TaxID=650164 RepID=K5VNJ4_PHACS|nr:uncharacterized protein PHACADRAFT_259209 [Phanerochaete carnosa HHB-10118-sp]EKM53038.1 hypothetical protein PHACADRAFT_259209 [Phanerochaete carnosa HHB-10118-sp]